VQQWCGGRVYIVGATAKTRFLINLPPNLASEKGAKQWPFDLFAGTPKLITAIFQS
jgi:hypothetical protein